jgi:multiple sugar transport system permease protein
MIVGRGGFVERNLKYIFPLPAVFFVFLLMIFPVGYTLYISFTDWTLTTARPMQFAGLQSYISVITHPRFHMAVLRTLIFTFGVVAVQTVLGVIIALILNREFTGKNPLKFILLLPMVVTPVAIGITFNLFYDPTIGFLNYVLSILGLPQSGWVSESRTVMMSLMMVDIWQWTPMIALIVMAGLAGLSSEPFESAKVDGANAVQTFFRITLPMVMPTILTAMVLRTVDALKTYDIIAVMTRGGPGFASETLNIHAFRVSFEHFALGRASAMLVLFFLLILFFSIGIMEIRKKFELN